MRLRANGIELEYEIIGRGSDLPIVMVMGFAQQLTAWEDPFCERLAGAGFCVVRFDNRDVGLSTKLDRAPRPNLAAILSGDLSTLAYSIEDMADDTAGLIAELGFDSAHLVGVSMGGMIAQSLAIRHPKRLRSLASIMSTTGDRAVGQAGPDVLPVLMRRPPAERMAAIEHGVNVWRTLSSPGYPFDDSLVRAQVTRAFDRDSSVDGVGRQAAAIAAQHDRTEALGEVRVPTVVIHGRSDPLIHVSGGEATARAIPGAKLVLVPGMGHDLPEPLWPLLLDEIVQNARRAS